MDRSLLGIVRAALLVLSALALPGALALDPYVLLLDWQEGHTLAPTSPFVTTPLAAAFAFEATRCHPHLLLDLLYAPHETGLDVDGVGEFAVKHEFRVEVWHEGARVLEKRVFNSMHGIPLGKLTAEGPHEVRLSLGWGAGVDWQMRLRARLATEDPACNPPL